MGKEQKNNRSSNFETQRIRLEVNSV